VKRLNKKLQNLSDKVQGSLDDVISKVERVGVAQGKLRDGCAAGFDQLGRVIAYTARTQTCQTETSLRNVADATAGLEEDILNHALSEKIARPSGCDLEVEAEAWITEIGSMDALHGSIAQSNFQGKMRPWTHYGDDQCL